MMEKEKQGSGLFIALLVMIVVAPTQWGMAIKGIPATPVDVVLGLSFLLWAGLALRKRASFGMPPACLWALVGVAVLSAVNCVRPFVYMAPGFEIYGDAMKAAAEVVQLVEYLLVAYVVVWAGLNNARQARTAGFVLVGVTALVVLGGLFHYFTQTDPARVFYVRSTFGSRHIYGGFLAMALPVVFALALRADDRRLRLGLLALVVAGAVTILSPGALLGLALALLLVASATSTRALQATLAGMVVFAGLSAVALPRNYQQNFYEPLHFKTADEMNLRAQWREWLAGAFLVQEYPLLGVGPGNFQRNLASAYGTHGLEYPGKARPGADVRVGLAEPDTNNLYLVTAASMGLLGLAALLWVLIFFGKTAAAAARRVGDEALRGLALGIWAGIIGFAVTSIFSSLMVRGTGITLAIFFAIAAALRYREWAVAESGQRSLGGLHVL